MGGSDAEPRLVDKARAIWRGLTLAAMALLGAAILVALVIVQSNANDQRDRALQLQRHSYDVMILTRTLSGTIARAEAALGRYVISGDQGNGRDFADQWDQARDQIDRLASITDDNHAQQAPIDRLRAAYQARSAELSVTALSTAYRKDRQAYARYYEAGKSASLREIDRQLEAIIATEHALLDARTAAAKASVDRSTAIQRVLTVFGVLIVFCAIVLGFFTIAAIKERAAAQVEADSERERAAVLEEAVEAATRALGQQEAKLRQVQKMEAVGQLTGGIAHDFNNMLAVVLGGLELARRGLDSDPASVAKHLDNATEGANRAAALTRRLLAFSREEALNPEPIKPVDAIAGMSDLLDRTLGDAITVERVDDGSGWRIWADRHELENTILNLAVNARDAMDGRGRLSIRTSAVTLTPGQIGHCLGGDHVAVAVADTGCGMAPELLDRVFEPFFTTKPVGQGTGLGLSQIFAFARQSGGEIAIESTPGEGTVVTLYLPRHNATSAIATQTNAAAPASAPIHAITGLGILVVEDDPRVLTATVGALEELGHHVVPCPDPLDAPRIVDDLGPFDLIVSDVLMPGQTGPEMVAGLLDRYPHLAVLFVTGYAGDGSAADFGGRPVLRKPFTIAGLERAIVDAVQVDRPLTDQIAAE
ncbi:ATP-binding protein [Sphingomonas sp.]|jgi:signal transduction histidine kinase/ActR/RegA family two-component response regulator|uniref:ATP-binding protein n=1 Tax=Sphingomonas sp. TaxID=28214 RepID=UPI002E2EFC9D|nr:ATP-binding protein [Sphingomonas sp.]HEX4695821.1 ATP-binding protein [Sphingomonas sp.]